MAAFVAIQDPETGRIQLHAAGCADVHRTEERTGRESWPVRGATLDEAIEDANFGFGDDDDQVDVKPCAQKQEG